jgi:RNA recognition motif-containing protein
MNKRLFVAGLPFSTTEEELKTFFTEIGAVVSVKIITDKETGHSRGFGFVEMSTPEEVTTAIAKFNGTDYDGRKLVVSEARPMEKRNYEGGFRQGGRNFFSGRREGGRGSFGGNRGYKFRRRGGKR